jgi:hypothetical protein
MENRIYIYTSSLITRLTLCDCCDNYSRSSSANMSVFQIRSICFANTLIVVLVDLCVVPPAPFFWQRLKLQASHIYCCMKNSISRVTQIGCGYTGAFRVETRVHHRYPLA